MKGLSLFHMVVVLAVVVAAARIAVPRLLHSETAANESGAVGSVLAINRAEVDFALRHPDRGYTCDLRDLEQARLLDRATASGVKGGYRLTLSDCNGRPTTSYLVSAEPLPKEGVRKYCSDQSGIIRYDSGTGRCTTASPPLE